MLLNEGGYWHIYVMSTMRDRPCCLQAIGLLCSFLLVGCETLPVVRAARNVTRSESPAMDSDLVKSLQRQIKERDRRIEELTNQLEALKAIDQDFANRRKPSHAPAISLRIE